VFWGVFWRVVARRAVSTAIKARNKTSRRDFFSNVILRRAPARTPLGAQKPEKKNKQTNKLPRI
jgi:hypothetical protein